MQCPACQAQNREQAHFCRECGARLDGLCPSCGREVEADSRFCDSCGADLRRPAPTAPQSRFASPQDYTPGYLAGKILRSRHAVEGERKQVTVLFADLKGSLELLADRDPEEARALLDGVIGRLMDAVHRYEGTVNNVMGDGIMAIFGAPLALEDHALRACYAALAMQAAMRRYAEEVRDSRGLAPQIRVGLNSGEVVVRAIRSDLHMDYSAIGQTTHLASRMEQLATPGTIRLTAETARLVEGFVQVASLGPVEVKGLAEPLEAFELLGAWSARTRLQVAAARGLTRFVGRQNEIEAMSRALDRAHAGQGQVVALVGEPGVGKSRLVWEFTQSPRTRGWLVLESSSVSYGRATAYGPVRDLLKRFFKVEELDDAPLIREKVTAEVLALDRALEEAIPAILSLFEVLPGDSAFLKLDPRDRRQRTLDAIRQLLLRESRSQPLLLVFEDLHWIDSETQALLDRLVDSLPTARVLLLVNYRTEYRHGWGSKTYYTQLRIDPLPSESAEELLEALLGQDPSLSPLKQRLVEQSERNPLFLEESVRTLVETHVLAGERGGYRLTKTLDAIQVPATVQAVLASRIDRLPPETKVLLQTASVIGKDVPVALLEAISDLPTEEFRSGLATLQDAEFLYEGSLFPEPEYTFRHALTLEVTYGTVLHDRRRALHGRIVEAIERLYADRLGEQVERLALHAFRGELWDRAVRYLRQAGAKAGAHFAHREAVAYHEQALTALGHLPESRETLEQAVDLRFELRNGLFALGELDPISELLQQATAPAEKLGDQRRLGWISAYMSHYHWRMGRYPAAIEAGQHAVAIAERVGDFALRTTNVNVGLAYYAMGDYRRAMHYMRQICAALEGERTRERFGWAGLPAVISRAYLVGCLAELGEFAEGVALGEEGIRLAEAADHPFSLGQATINLGVLYVRKGDLPLATAVLERGLGVSGVSNVPVLAAGLSSALGYAYALAGRLREAIPLLERGVEQGAARRITARHSLWLAWLGEAYLLAERNEDAIRVAGRALELSQEHGERGNYAHVLRLLGEIGRRCGPQLGQPPEDVYQQTLAVAGELEMRPLLAHCRLGLGARCRQLGKLDEARHALMAASELFGAMEMTFWRARADAELAQLSVT